MSACMAVVRKLCTIYLHVVPSEHSWRMQHCRLVCYRLEPVLHEHLDDMKRCHLFPGGKVWSRDL